MEQLLHGKRYAACLLAALLAALAAALVFALPVPAATPETAAPRTIRVGYYESAGFQEYDPATDSYSGYSYEFLMALAQYTDWTYEFVPCGFSEGLQLLQEGQIDLMNNVSRTPERESIYRFTTLASGENIAYLAMKPGPQAIAYEDYDAIGGIRIGLASDSIYSQQLLDLLAEKGITPNVTMFDSRTELTDAFASGAVDAYIVTSSAISDEHIILSFAPDTYYMAVAPDDAALATALDSAIMALRTNDPAFEARIKEKYYGQATENYIVLTAEEQAYLAENPTVRVSYQPDWFPLSYQDEKGNFAGAVRGVYDLLAERTGLQFEYIPLDNSDESNDVTESYDTQIMAELPSDFSYVEKFGVKITRPFISPALMEVSSAALAPGDTIALVEGDYISQLAHRFYGDAYTYLACESVDACMQAVQARRATATVLISYESEYYRQQYAYNRLTYRIIDEGSYSLSIAVANTADPRLYQIVQKGLNAISDGEIANVFNNTLLEVRQDDLLGTLYSHPLQVAIALVAFVALALGVMFGIYYNSKLKRKNAVINTQNAELQRVGRANAAFFANMSHDMRTPLNGILGTTALALEEPHSDKIDEYLGDIRYSGRFLLNLINDVLDMSKMENDAMELFPESYSYKQFIRDMARMFEPLCREKNITLDLHPLDSDACIWVDKMRFQQIFFNIFSNAVKYTPAGGRIDHYSEFTPLDEKHIDCKCHIVDTGIGMSKEFCQKLFEPYQREQQNDNVQGTGLGLAIANRLAHLMGGEILINSELGKGTEVIVHTVLELVPPPADAAAADTAPEPASPAVDFTGRRFLLCEDHPLNTKIAVRLLEKRGATVDTAANGELGIKLFADSAPGAYDLVLMDIRMPVLDGLEAARRIRALPRADAKTVPILAMTANAYESDVKNALDAGMNAHLAKPIEPELLYASIAHYLTPKGN